MPPRDLQPAIEALLFSSDQPLTELLIAESLETPIDEIAPALQRLSAAYAERGAGVELREIAGGWMLVTTAEHAEWVGRMLRGKKRMRLSRPALETMAIIAYKQPVTKSEVEAIRGVDSSAVLATLLERSLVTIRGRSKVVGRPLLYGTTQEFLDYFGLKDLTELPRPEELRALVAAREPEQLDMMELEVVSQVASDLAAGEAAGEVRIAHEVEPLDDAADEDEELEEFEGDDEDDEDEAESENGDDEDEDGDDEDEDDEDEDGDEDDEGEEDDEDDEGEEDDEDDEGEEDDEDDAGDEDELESESEEEPPVAQEKQPAGAGPRDPARA
jgi:segregation and condensation protein B